MVDQAVLLVFRAPRSYTTEDVVEIQSHGGTAILQKVLSLCLQEGARLATAGEFTKRAYLGGRFDLAQAEAIADLIGAKTEKALENALSQLDGGLSRDLKNVRESLIEVLARVEAAIDFPDEIEEPKSSEILSNIEGIEKKISLLLSTARQGRILREGMAIALVGNPNVGKSSLLNALLREERAIVTDLPGTTRDLIEENLDIGGYLFRIQDTAGIRDGAFDEAEKLGILRSLEAIRKADALLYLVDASLPPAPLPFPTQKNLLVLANKIDLVEDREACLAGWEEKLKTKAIPVSAKSGEGLSELTEALVALAEGTPLVPHCAINARHQGALSAALGSLEASKGALLEGLPLDFLTIDLKAAVSSLGEVTGEEVSEEIIEKVFANFCVGK
jgi:tRNA modification GTPase